MKSTKFLNNMFAVFLLRVKPASHRAKPGCMKNTSIAASSIHTVSTESDRSATGSVAKNMFVIIVSFLYLLFILCYVLLLS